MFARTVQKALEALPSEFQTDAARNTLQYVFESIGHDCMLLIKHKDTLSQIKLRPTKISDRYRSFFPKTLKHNKKVRLLHCIVKEFDDDKEGDYFIHSIFRRYEEAGYTIPQGVYLITPTDALIYRKNFKDPFYHVTGSTDTPIPLQHPLLPILAMSGHKDYLDVPIVNWDDGRYIKGKISLDTSKLELDFSKKKPIAIFRGGTTGCGWTADTNPRLKAVQLSKTYPTLLDAQVTTITNSMKFHKTRRVGRVNPKEFRAGKYIPFEEQSQYKYILHLDGNVAAYRLGQSMLLGSVILLQESGSSVWFQYHMKPWKHYVPIKEDLSDLIDQIEWCKKHESECSKIAHAGRTLALRMLTPESLFRELEHAIQTARRIARTNEKIEIP
jgi:hypothetical protein